MPRFVVDPTPAPALLVSGGGLFPIRRIFCVGRNYADHVREMGGDPAREEPFFFTKPADAVVTGGADMPYPGKTQDLHFEMELVVAIGGHARDLPLADAWDVVFGYAAGLDMTRRDLQAAAKKAGRPWDMAKGFDHSAPIGTIVPAVDTGRPSSGTIELRVNGKSRQRSDIARMIWSVPEIVSCLSGFVALAPGDVIFTGTPEGVGAAVPGDTLEGSIAGIGAVRTRII